MSGNLSLSQPLPTSQWHGKASFLSGVAEVSPPVWSAEKIFTKLYKGVRNCPNCSRGVFANQHWKCSHACRPVLEVLSVSHVSRCRPMVIALEYCNLTSVQNTAPSVCIWERVQEDHAFFFSIIRIALCASTALTTTMLTRIELSEVRTDLSLTFVLI